MPVMVTERGQPKTCTPKKGVPRREPLHRVLVSLILLFSFITQSAFAATAFEFVPLQGTSDSADSADSKTQQIRPSGSQNTEVLDPAALEAESSVHEIIVKEVPSVSKPEAAPLVNESTREAFSSEEPFDAWDTGSRTSNLAAIEAEGAILPQIEEKRIRSADAFLENQHEVMTEVLEIQGRFLTHLDRARAVFLGGALTAEDRQFETKEMTEGFEGRRDEAGFREAMEAGADFLKLDTKGLGKAELVKINGAFASRVVHEKTGMVFVLLDKAKIDRNSKHFKQYIARQHLRAGKAGRNVVLVWADSNQTGGETVMEYSPKPSIIKNPWQWWREFYHATWVTPTKTDVVLATFSVLGQSTLMLAVAGADYALNGKPFDVTAAALSATWAFGLGMVITPYKNYVDHGPPLWRLIKDTPNSILFGYTLDVLRHNTMNSITIEALPDMIGRADHHRIWSNMPMSKVAGDAWKDISRVREAKRINTGLISTKLPILKLLNGVKRQNLERQAIYLVPFLISKMDLLNFSVVMPYVGQVKLGRILLFTSIFVVKYLAVRYAEKLSYEHRERLRQEFYDLLTGAILWRPVLKAGKKALRVILDGSKHVANHCEGLMKPKSGS